MLESSKDISLLKEFQSGIHIYCDVSVMLCIYFCFTHLEPKAEKKAVIRESQRTFVQSGREKTTLSQSVVIHYRDVTEEKDSKAGKPVSNSTAFEPLSL